MNLTDLPVVYKILQDEQLTPEATIENDKVVCSDTSGNKYIVKDCRGIEEKIFTEVFPAIKSMNLSFQILELPEHLKVRSVVDKQGKESKKFIIIKFYEGTYFNEMWNELSALGYGGRSVDLNFSDKVVDLLEDFASIEVDNLIPYNLLTFNLDRWKTHNSPIEFKHFIENGILTDEQLRKGLTILNSPSLFQKSKMILTNGDFYPRNFIELSNGKTVVIDWEGRIDYEDTFSLNGNTEKFTGQRNALINYIENHLAFFFVHMWGNDPLQKAVLKKATKRFNLSVDDIQAALIIKSLEQTHHFSKSFLALRQAEIFINALNQQYIKDLLN